MTPKIMSAWIAALGCACAAEPAANEWQAPPALKLATCGQTSVSDRFVLAQVATDGTDVLVPVSVGGGCRAHRFAACWDGSVLDRDPGAVNIVVSHDAGGDTCDALLEFDLRVDLAPVLAKYAVPLDIIVSGAESQYAGTTNSVRIGR
jgi:hypothetical protein